ncbi:MAG: helix-turn-helix domain-containing protein [Sphingomonadales bacterium]|nr:helix-turn-helix domain-containing protein [Sphingomonadales bacterium]MDE2169607.1 helix-turn-helix domain-containing protein [Sphingomonadales bacterium]
MNSFLPPKPETDARISAPATGPKPLTVRIPEAARMTGLGRTKLYDLIASGDIAVVKIGRATLITMASIEALLERCGQSRP